MATEPVPQPQVNLPITDSSYQLSLPWRQYMPKLDAAVRGVVNMISGKFTSSVPLVQVATPTNANAASAGVAVGQLYTSTANPAPVYIRTA